MDTIQRSALRMQSRETHPTMTDNPTPRPLVGTFDPALHLPGEYEFGRLIREAVVHDAEKERFYLTCSVGALAQRIARALASEPAPVGTREQIARAAWTEWWEYPIKWEDGSDPERAKFLAIADRIIALASPSAGGATGAEPIRQVLEELVDIVQLALDEQSLDNMDSFTLQPAREVLRAAAAEQPRTVGRETHPLWVRLYDAICGDAHTSPPFHDTFDDTPPETREVSDAMNAIHAFYGGHPWATDPDARAAAAPEGSPAPEPRTQERETLADRLDAWANDIVPNSPEDHIRHGQRADLRNAAATLRDFRTVGPTLDALVDDG